MKDEIHEKKIVSEAKKGLNTNRQKGNRERLMRL